METDGLSVRMSLCHKVYFELCAGCLLVADIYISVFLFVCFGFGFLTLVAEIG